MEQNADRGRYDGIAENLAAAASGERKRLLQRGFAAVQSRQRRGDKRGVEEEDSEILQDVPDKDLGIERAEYLEAMAGLNPLESAGSHHQRQEAAAQHGGRHA